MVYAKKKNPDVYPDIHMSARYEVTSIGQKRFMMANNKRRYDVADFWFYIDGRKVKLQDVRNALNGMAK